MTNKSFSDLTKIDVPFGELDIETKLALHRAHYEGKEIENRGGRMNWVSVRTPSWFNDGAYRVKPEPKVVKQEFYIRPDEHRVLKYVFPREATHILSYNTIDGEIDCSSVKMEKV